MVKERERDREKGEEGEKEMRVIAAVYARVCACGVVRARSTRVRMHARSLSPSSLSFCCSPSFFLLSLSPLFFALLYFECRALSRSSGDHQHSRTCARVAHTHTRAHTN